MRHCKTTDTRVSAGFASGDFCFTEGFIIVYLLPYNIPV